MWLTGKAGEVRGDDGARDAVEGERADGAAEVIGDWRVRGVEAQE